MSNEFKEFVSKVPNVITLTIGATIFLAVLLFTSCTMVVTESGEEAAAKIAAQATLEKQRNTAIETLISEHGINPIAARCAIIGWNEKQSNNNADDRELCEEAAKLPLVLRRAKSLTE